ncbi:MAG: recombinase family protein [Nitrososphaerota archaeon]
MEMTLVGLYARVSTKDKEQNPENQLIRLREYCKSKGWEYKEYVDYASGANKDRPGLKAIMNDLDNLDGILVLRLDRFGRSLQNLLESLNIIRSKGKFFEAVDQGLKISEKKDPMNDFMLAILGAAAEFERELISERVKDGMARARKENKKIGRPAILEKRGIDPSKIRELRESGKSIREISQIVGIKRSTVHGILKSLSEKPISQKD